ncbi:hypothetical protein ABNE21_17115 [Paenibacillus larvae]
MADISKYLKQIRTAIYGREVRSSIADGIEAVNTAQETLDQKFDDQIANMTPPNNPSLAEVVDARTSGVTGNKYVTLGKRLDSGEIESRTYTDEKISELVLGEVRSVNGKTGNVVLTASDVEAVTYLEMREELRKYALLGEPGGQYTPDLLNGWYVQAGEVKGVCYYKDQFGYVHIYGAAEGGKTDFGTVLFNLPAGFRPSGIVRIGCVIINWEGYARSIQFLGVYPSGEVLIESNGLPGKVTFCIFPSTFYCQR